MLTKFAVDESAHNRDGLAIEAYDGDQKVDAFISRRIMDKWVEPITPFGRRQSLFRSQYNYLGRTNLEVIARLVDAKYARGPAFNRQHPYVEILTSDIVESGATIDQTGLVRDPLPPAFERVPLR
jgi:hypothetical protein